MDEQKYSGVGKKARRTSSADCPQGKNGPDLSKAIYPGILDNIPGVVTFQNAENRILWANHAASELLDRSPDQIVGRYCHEVCDQEEKLCAKCPVAKAIETKQPQEGEMASRNGTWWHIHAHPVHDDSGALQGVVQTCFDITERKRKEAEFQASEETIYALLNAQSESSFLLDIDGTILAANEVGAERYGMSVDEIIGKSAWEIAPPEIASLRKTWLNKVVQTREPVHFDDERDGKHFNNNMYPILDHEGEITRIAVLARDITEHRRVQEAYRTSEETVQALLNIAGGISFLIDAEGVLLTANQALASRFDKTVDELVGTCVYDLLPPDLAASRKARIDEIRQSGRPCFFEDERAGCVFENHVYPIRNSAGECVRAAVLVYDVTERRKAERQLLQSEERFRQVTENAEWWVWEVNADGLFTYCSPALEALLGYVPEEVVGKKSFNDFFHPEDRDELLEQVKKLVSAKRPFMHFTRRCLAKDGETVWLSTSGVPRVDTAGKFLGYRGVDSDVTLQKKTEEALEAQSMVDDLTGLHNRRAFYALAESQMQIAKRSKTKLLLLYFDIDSMKEINDTYGHREGDKALIMAAHALRHTFRESDIIARIGGDEFVVIARDTNKTCAKALLDRLQRQIDNTLEEITKAPMSFSVGVATYDPDHPCSLEALTHAADKKMYHQKIEKKRSQQEP